ncbi:Bacterial Ig-like domain (group 2) [compost metagenome]
MDLEAEVTPIGASQTVTWSTSDATKATVSETGLVTGVAVGSATITATSVADPTKIDTCAVTVTA